MVVAKVREKKKDLNRLHFNGRTMKKGKVRSRRGDLFFAKLKEAQKDPGFIADIDRFIKATTRIYKLQ
jgi:hypothetical protein